MPGSPEDPAAVAAVQARKDREGEGMTTKTEQPFCMPCPFCKGSAQLRKTRHGRPVLHWVACEKCGAASGAYNSAESAMASWNSREAQ